MIARWRLDAAKSGRRDAALRAGWRGAAAACLALVALAACESKGRPPPETVQAPPPVAAPAPLERAVPLDIAPEAAAIRDTLPMATTPDGVRVAVLLPLSGPTAAVGRALLDAAQLAVFDVADARFSIMPRDTAGTPEGAAAAADAAIADGARLIVGPLFAAEVGAVAPRARGAGVSVLSLSNDLAIAAPGVFVLGVPPRAQVERIIAFARSRGFSRHAALLPNNGYGAAVEAALRETVRLTGGQVAAIERYDPATKDASPVVRRLAAYENRRAALQQQRKQLEASGDDVSRQALRRLEGLDTLGEVEFDSVLLPDFGDRLLAIAPLLPYYDIDPARVRLLGTALWDDGRITREPALSGAWFAAPPPEARAGFVQRYRELYRRDPPRVATIAYDAVALAAVLARSEREPDFSPDALTNPVGFAGMDGVFRLKSDGSIERNLAVLEVRRNGFRTISPAAESFDAPTQ